MLHSGMFSHHSLIGITQNNKFTDDGKRALRAAAAERKAYPDFVALDLGI